MAPYIFVKSHRCFQFFPELEVRIMSKFGSFGLADPEYKRILILRGNTHEINEKLANLWYKNQMFDTRAYKDLVTLWIKGFPELHFEIQVKREQLELLQVSTDFVDFNSHFIVFRHVIHRWHREM